MTSSGLGSRSDALERLAGTSGKDPLDVLVVGGGITGAGIALDAASRGMRVGLVERFDFASGTSSKSSKLVHGGLRYLEQREFGLMREAAAERDLLRRLAPHLVEAIPFVLPISNRKRRAFFGVGLWAYDALATFRNLHVHRYIDGSETSDLVPALPRGKLRGGFLFYDCKTDDVRLVMELLVQSCRYGADVANYAVARDIEGSTDLCTTAVEDSLTGETFDVVSRRVVVAAGVWTDQVESMARHGAPRRLTPSKGIHLVFRKEDLPLADAAAFIPDITRKRMLFVIPWRDSVLVGTTDTSYEGSLDRPTVDDADRTYCLDSLNAAFGLSLTTENIAGAYAGLRPLVAGKAGATADLSRRHAIYEIAPGVTGITGGKLTIYRRMAKDMVDRVADELGHPGKCRTRWIKLGCSDVGALSAAVQRRSLKLGLEPGAAANLVRTYGDRAMTVLDVAEENDLVAPLVEGYPSLAAEAVYAARSEMACHLGDLLARRTRIALTNRAAGLGPSSNAVDVLGDELGWGDPERTRQRAAHRMEVELERGMPLAPGSAVVGEPRARTG
ncbi:MAG: glycerol-3-phosphate dehydrogenase/oxidase [Actinomycetota bacterium]|nr:glycerol-3-phosphate dehydrogenase/oxidase [Actinomycetota bacterium]